MNIWILNHHAVTPDMSGGTRHYDFAKELVKRGHEVTIVASSFHYSKFQEMKNYDGKEYLIEEIDGIKFIWFQTPPYFTNGIKRVVNMLVYAKKALQVLPTLNLKKPDILHAHYASSYGLIGALSGFSPFILSVWGSDIFSFPKRSFLHKCLIKFNLSKADKILSTSHIMAQEIRLYTQKSIEVTPFGIDMEYFKPMHVESLFDKNDIVIGTVKTLEETYGIEYLIRAFKILHDKHKELPLKLLIVGEGSLKLSLKKLVKELHIENKVIFTGKVSYDKVPKYHNMLTVYVSVSNSESFGVSVLEASSCAKPVVVSNIGGLSEVVEDGVSGFIVPAKNPKKTAKAIEKLVLCKDLRLKIGRAGRERVRILYNWDDNVSQMLHIYIKLF